MKLAPDQALRVSLRGDGPERAVGRLAWRDRRAWFEYDPSFLGAGIELSPFRLPLRPGVLEAPPKPFDGLFGVFDDSLPDGWGRLLQDRHARAHGIPPASLTPLDRLAWVGRDAIGALAYRPELVRIEPDGTGVDLDGLARAAAAVLAGASDEVLPELLRLGGSPQGARPKVLVWLDPGAAQVSSVPPADPSRWRPVLVKFRGRGDPEDAGALELVWHGLARRAGVAVPDAWLLPSRAGPGWFAVERFDLDAGTGARRHVHSLCGLLHADHRVPSLDYEGAIAATLRLTRDHRASEQMFRRMVFNVCAHNRDDHTRQIAFRMDGAGRWQLAPAFDLTFSDGPGGEHAMAVAGSGRPDRTAMRALARDVGLRAPDAERVIDEVATAVREGLAEAGMSASTRRRIDAELPRI